MENFSDARELIALRRERALYVYVYTGECVYSGGWKFRSKCMYVGGGNLYSDFVCAFKAFFN